MLLRKLSLKPVNLVQTDATTPNDVGSCWPTMLRPFARGVRLNPWFHCPVEYQFLSIMDLDNISLQVISLVGAVLLVVCTVSVSSFGSLKVCVLYELK